MSKVTLRHQTLTRGPWTAEALNVLAGAVPDLTDIPTAASTVAVHHNHEEL
jgi:hypothetical protein